MSKSTKGLLQVKALMFDVFGTLTDWRGTLIREGRDLESRKKLKINWEEFADAWRAEYAPSMKRVNEGELPWKNIDTLHRMILEELISASVYTAWRKKIRKP